LGCTEAIGWLGLIHFSYNEGKESFEKEAGMEVCSREDAPDGRK